MPTNLEFLCRFVLIQNRPAFVVDNLCNPISCRRSEIPTDVDFLQLPKFLAAKSVVAYVPLISKSNENMGFVGDISHMDVILLVVSDLPIKLPRFADLLLLFI